MQTMRKAKTIRHDKIIQTVNSVVAYNLHIFLIKFDSS